MSRPGVRNDSALHEPERRRWHRKGVCSTYGPVVRRLVLLPAVPLHPLADVVNLVKVLVLVDEQLPLPSISSAGLSATSLASSSVDVLVIDVLAVADNHVPVLVQVLKSLRESNFT